VLRLLKKGKHWVLVTLLLSNVITNETLPIVLDRSLGGGWPAILGSTVLIGIYFSRLLIGNPPIGIVLMMSQ
jgi:metal transporter CNNM